LEKSRGDDKRTPPRLSCGGVLCCASSGYLGCLPVFFCFFPPDFLDLPFPCMASLLSLGLPIRVGMVVRLKFFFVFDKLLFEVLNWPIQFDRI
jgi:hypothetical protein